MYTKQAMDFLVYVDDLLFIGQDNIVKDQFSAIQKQLMLRPTGELSMEQPISFPGRDITNKGDHYEINLNKDYAAKMLEEAGMTTCKAAATPGTAANRTSNDHNDNVPVDKDEHALYRRIVRKLQWMTHTRPDLSCATKELARSFQQPTYLDMKKMKHTLRYLQGTKDYKFILHPTTIPGNKDTTTGTQWHTISAQNRYLGQHCRHIHKVCHCRDSQQTPLQRWAFKP